MIAETDLRPAAEHWLLALDAAGYALSAAEPVLPAAALNARRRELASERQASVDELMRLARETHAARSLSSVSELFAVEIRSRPQPEAGSLRMALGRQPVTLSS